MELDKSKIGMRIRAIRKNIYHESIKAFAKRCNLSYSHLSNIENGKILITTRTLDKFYLNAGIHLNYILYGEPDDYLNFRTFFKYYLHHCSKDELSLFLTIISEIESMKEINS